MTAAAKEHLFGPYEESFEGDDPKIKYKNVPVDDYAAMQKLILKAAKTATQQDERCARLESVLRRIAREYQTPAQLRRNSEKQYGISFPEALEMAYENIQAEARAALIRRRRARKPKPAHGGKAAP